MRVALSKALQLLGSVNSIRTRLFYASRMKTVSHHWSREAQDENRLSRGFHWVESDLVQAQINELISGDPELDWANYVFRKYLLASGTGLQRGLSLGCGDGRLERHMRRVGACDYIDALDIAEGAIARAQEITVESGIGGIVYRVADLNNITLPAQHYDVVMAASILHHISNLEGLLDEVRSSLKTDGLLIANEYVAPAQFQTKSHN